MLRSAAAAVVTAAAIAAATAVAAAAAQHRAVAAAAAADEENQNDDPPAATHPVIAIHNQNLLFFIEHQAHSMLCRADESVTPTKIVRPHLACPKYDRLFEIEA